MNPTRSMGARRDTMNRPISFLLMNARNCWPWRTPTNSFICLRARSFPDWPISNATSPRNRPFTGYSERSVSSLTGAVIERPVRAPNRVRSRPTRQTSFTAGISPICRQRLSDSTFISIYGRIQTVSLPCDGRLAHHRHRAESASSALPRVLPPSDTATSEQDVCCDRA